MHTGIMDVRFSPSCHVHSKQLQFTLNLWFFVRQQALDQKIEKRSPTLNRDAVYSQKSRLARLPAYLAVHMVRFAWRRDISKKAKIMVRTRLLYPLLLHIHIPRIADLFMYSDICAFDVCGYDDNVQRKVKFPTEFDALDLATDELKAKLLPASRRLKEIEKERAERRKVRKRTKEAQEAQSKAAAAASTSTAPESTPGTATTTAPDGGDVQMAEGAPAAEGGADGDAEMTAATGENTVEEKMSEEERAREKERRELEQLVDPEVRDDVGCSETGLYELVGA